MRLHKRVGMMPLRIINKLLNLTNNTISWDARAEVGKPLIYLDSVFDYLREYGTNICGIVSVENGV